MTKAEIIFRLLNEKLITVEEANILMDTADGRQHFTIHLIHAFSPSSYYPVYPVTVTSTT